VHLPYATSHIDIAPTLLALNGIPTDGLFYQGENMLDRRMSARLVFLLTGGLTMMDGFYWRRRYLAVDHLTGSTIRQIEPTRPGQSGAPSDAASAALSDQQIKATVAGAYQIARATAAYWLHGAIMPHPAIAAH
jgi:hypothetical protein